MEYLALMRERLGRLVPVTAGLGLRRLWAATIDFTPDHLPIIGPALGPAGQLDGVTVACAGGAGMMWGPAVSRAAADVALTGATDVVDVSVLGLGRFDEAGHSSLAADPVALPFPQTLLTQQPASSPQAPPSPPAVSSPQEQPVPLAPGVQRRPALPNAQAVRQAELQAELPAQAPAT
jgi:sarcosine oxidase, subunit beta